MTPEEEAAEARARIIELEAAEQRHLKLIRDLTQAPLPEDCAEARTRVGVLTAKCSTLRRALKTIASGDECTTCVGVTAHLQHLMSVARMAIDWTGDDDGGA